MTVDSPAPAVKLIVVGGFLGAGKTTSIVSLAKRLLLMGRKIGIVTNDQGSDLVDTEYLRKSGLPVMEVTGGCFCCNFDEFTAKLNEMSAGQYPQYILAEPVGSCTDLVATIMKPIGRGLAGRFLLSPLSVVVDPKRLRRVAAEQDSPFPNEINYLFKKQLEEADIIAINKCDTVDAEELGKLEGYLREHYRGSEIVHVSAKDGLGMDDWLERLALPQSGAHASLDIDYDTYARAEAALGWLNTTCTMIAIKGMDANAVLECLASCVRARLKAGGNEIAHLKMYMVSGSDFCKLSCVGNEEAVQFDHRMALPCSEASLTVNLRAGAAPERLKGIVEGELLAAKCGAGATLRGMRTQSFSPSYPKPKHRIQM
jgi:Ni2+-binding GTPase involved in maturation of urease and hydrogenase